MKYLFSFLVLFSLNAHAGFKVDCVAGDLRFTVSSQGPSDLKVTYKGETVDADGILNTDEVDLVAKFRSIGEMTLFAKVGKVDSGSYIFTLGQRISVVCR